MKRGKLYIILLGVLVVALISRKNYIFDFNRIVSRESAKNLSLVLLAFAFFLSGHFFRIKNARKLVSTVSGPTGWIPILRSISVGYLFNALLPFKLGDLVRAVVLADEIKIGRGTILLTIIFERLFDCVILSGAVLAILWGSGLGAHHWNLAVELSSLPIILLSVGISLFAFLGVIYWQSKLFLRAGYKLSALFNNRIRDQFRFRIWSAIHGIHTLVRDTDLRAYTLTAASMWGCYLLGTFVLTLPYGRNIFDQFLIGALSQISSSMQLNAQGFDHAFEYLVKNQSSVVKSAPLLLLPRFVLFLQLAPLGFLGIFLFLFPSWKAQKSSQPAIADPRVNKLQRQTDISGEFSGFLDEYFSGTELFQHVNQAELQKDFRLLRTFKGGSNAITLLGAGKEGTPFVRKVALNRHADKLKAQYEWLSKYGHHAVIADAIKEDIGHACYSYDVRFYPRAKTFFDFIHSNPVSSSEQILDEVMAFLMKEIYQPRILVTSPESVQAYIEGKVINKLFEAGSISPVLFQLLQADTITVNGERCMSIMAVIDAMQNDSKIMDDLIRFEESPVHGDLTIDNLLVEDSQFIILDPNNENFISSMAVDFGKMYQSLHSGYEFLVKLDSVEVNGTAIDFEENISNKYHSLFRYLDGRLKESLPPEVYRSLLFHEAVHYCRMLPYRVRINPYTAPAFFGVAVRIFNEYLRQYRYFELDQTEKENNEKVAHINAYGRTRQAI